MRRFATPGYEPELVKSYGWAILPDALNNTQRPPRGQEADRQPLGADAGARRRNRDRRLREDRRVGAGQPGRGPFGGLASPASEAHADRGRTAYR